MAETWRNILERAADNLSIELDRNVPRSNHPNARQPAQRQPLSRQPASRQSVPRQALQARPTSQYFAESRDLLERELEALSPQRLTNRLEEARVPDRRSDPASVTPREPVFYPPVVVPREAQRRRPQQRRRSPWRNVLVVAVSAAILCAAGYIVRSYLQAVQFPAQRAQSLQTEHAAFTAPKASAPLSRANEDMLLERASNQLVQGNGTGARAVYDMLARFSSQRGTFGLAETYDPNALALHPDWRLKADLRLAREWYRKAAELGSLAASQRLKDLDSGSQR